MTMQLMLFVVALGVAVGAYGVSVWTSLPSSPKRKSKQNDQQNRS
jgi:hypothetical protein